MNRRSIPYLSSIALLLAIAQSLSAQAHSVKNTKSEAALKELASLAGKWGGVQDGVPIELTYTVTANGSAVMEEAKPSDGGSMITMFTADGDRLMATHYCAVGNQPQMASTMPGDFKNGVSFSLLRVTGMKTPGDWHNTGLTLTLDDNDHMTQRWTYAYKGKSGVNVFHYTRKK
ncbi:MAG TPA: hypothetical protein VJ852_15320 [Gemmatimonadaceae bacterium]|nr:hypothetical protein [Gemmatimonadaceae bacterium]